MAKQPAAVKSTGGGGFWFEDRVAAFLSAQLLVAHQYFGPSFGPVIQIDFQARDQGWLLDDLVATCAGQDRQRHAAISVRSDRQVTEAGFPSDFVASVWEQWFQIDTTAFEEDRDILALAVGQLAANVKRAWDSLLTEATAADPRRIVERLRKPRQSSAIERSLFESLRCPELLRSSGHGDEVATAALVKHIRLLPFDFQSDPSRDEAAALDLCRLALADGNSCEARSLWDKLVKIASELRPAGGTLDLVRLFDTLRPHFRLVSYPDHRSDWRRLTQRSSATAEPIRDFIAGNVSLDRTHVRDRISQVLTDRRALALVGESGCGKSALTKQLATSGAVAGTVVWLSANDLDRSHLDDLRQHLGLENDLASLLKGTHADRALLVFDGVDRYSATALQCTAALLKSLSSPEGSVRQPWLVLINSEPAGWERVSTHLIGAGVDPRLISIETIGFPSVQETRQMLLEIPQLACLASRGELIPVLCNLKVLDWVAAASLPRQDMESRAWVGMSDVMDWIWEFWTGTDADRLARGGVLKKLAEIEGAGLTNAVPLARLDHDELRTLGTPQLNHLVYHEDERVRFTHDLIGDWSRVRVLIGEENVQDALVRRALLPRWHRAIRLYGQRLLEQNREGTRAWRTFFDQCAGHENASVLTRDLLLEALFCAVNASELLERCWADLIEQDGALLKRLLGRFLHSATLPDPRIIPLAKTAVEASWLASMMRIPYGPYWLPVLELLRGHLDEIKTQPHLFSAVSDVCGLWLRTVPHTLPSGEHMPGRRDAADVAVRLAREVQGLKGEEVYFADEMDQEVYEAALHAAPDLPDAVSTMALELVRRRDPAAEIQARAAEHWRLQEERQRELLNDPEYVKRLRALPVFPGLGRLPSGSPRDPWPEGPREKVDSAFQTICLDKPATFQALIATRPAVAREVLLGACIEPPKLEDPFGNDLALLDQLGTDGWPQGFPPMYFQGPFLQFLRLQPREGLEVILRLVNFATDRRVDSERRHRRYLGHVCIPPAPPVIVHVDDGRREWRGDASVYGWHRNLPPSAHCVACGLMALEKWLYDESEKEGDVNPWIDLILDRSSSVAFAGVLVALGLSRPQFFEGPLRPLLGVWQLYGWHEAMLRHGDLWQIEALGWARHSEEIFNLAQEWHHLPHRRNSFRDRAIALMLSRPSIAQHFVEVRARWRDELQATGPNEPLELLIARFDPSNYRSEERDDGAILIQLEWPEPLRQRTEASLRETEEALSVLGFPIRCRQMLEDGNSLSADELNTLWHELQVIAQCKAAPKKGLSEQELASAVCGGIAVLLLLHQAWLEQHPERRRWCTQKLDAILKSLHSASDFETAESMTDLTWDSFACQSLVVLLAAGTKRLSMRRQVAEALTGPFYATTALGMWTAFNERERLGREFTRLQNLLVLWAALRSIIRTARRCETDTMRWCRWYDGLVRRFQDARIPEEPLDWQRAGQIAQSAMHRIEKSRYPGIDDLQDVNGDHYEPLVATGNRRRKGGWRLHPGLDLQLIKAAFSWIPTLDCARDPKERMEWVTLLRQALGITVAMLPDTRDADREVNGTPYDYDRWVFEKIAIAVAQMASEEEPSQLWRPILDLGPPAHYWVSTFLASWFIRGARVAASPEAFVDRWREMIDHVLGSSLWSPDGGALSFRAADLLGELMGFSWHSRSLDDPPYATTMASLRPQFVAFSKQWLCVPQLGAQFASFLARPAGAEFVCDGIRWLGAVVPAYKSYERRQEQLDDNLVEALRTCWYRYAGELQRNSELKQAFLTLLGEIMQRQNQAAFELRDEVVRAIGA